VVIALAVSEVEFLHKWGAALRGEGLDLQGLAVALVHAEVPQSHCSEGAPRWLQGHLQAWAASPVPVLRRRRIERRALRSWKHTGNMTWLIIGPYLMETGCLQL